MRIILKNSKIALSFILFIISCEEPNKSDSIWDENDIGSASLPLEDGRNPAEPVEGTFRDDASANASQPPDDARDFNVGIFPSAFCASRHKPIIPHMHTPTHEHRNG